MCEFCHKHGEGKKRYVQPDKYFVIMHLKLHFIVI